MHNKVELYKQRDFSQVFADSVAFIKRNFKGLLRSLVVIVAPLYVISSVMMSMFSINVIDAASQADTYYGSNRQNILFDTIFGWNFFIAMLLAFVTIVLAISVVFGYIKLYGENKQEITPADVWQEIRNRAARLFFFLLGYMFVLFIGFFLISLVLTLSLAALVIIPIIGPIIIVCVFFIFMLASVTFITILLPVVYYENDGFFESIGRVIRLLRGNFWQTMAVTFVSAVAVQLLASIVYQALLQGIEVLKTGTEQVNVNTVKTILIVYFTVTPIVLFFGYLFQFSASGFAYFGLIEKLEYIGLRKKVEAINEIIDIKPEEQY
ncbi:MAG: hypothetical protein ACO1PI_07800 [Bacteroidota bacterium]